jgi:hypothetical protein
MILKAITMDVDASKLSPSTVVDEVWHAMLLFPMDYSDLCDAILPRNSSSRLIDHNPLGGDDMEAREVRYQETRVLYEKTFRELPPSDIWGSNETEGKKEATPEVTSRKRARVEKTVQDDGEIHIVIRDPSWQEMHFRVKRTTPVMKILDAYTRRAGLRVKDVVLIYEGLRVLMNDTPNSLEVDDGDVFDVYSIQSGC